MLLAGQGYRALGLDDRQCSRTLVLPDGLGRLEREGGLRGGETDLFPEGRELLLCHDRGPRHGELEGVLVGGVEAVAQEDLVADERIDLPFLLCQVECLDRSVPILDGRRLSVVDFDETTGRDVGLLCGTGDLAGARLDLELELSCPLQVGELVATEDGVDAAGGSSDLEALAELLSGLAEVVGQLDELLAHALERTAGVGDLRAEGPVQEGREVLDFRLHFVEP